MKTDNLNSGKGYNMIKGFTIDPNEYCNASCWFCVNRYRKQTPNNMSIKDMEIIIDKILKERGHLVEENLNIIYFHHFNEILLYPYFEEMLELLRKKKLETHIFSNGTTLTPEKYDLMIQYTDVIKSLLLSVPSLDKSYWKLHMGLSDNDFNKLISNLNYIHGKKHIKTTIEVNGTNKESFYDNNGVMMKMKNYPKKIKVDLDEQYDDIKKKYPKFKYYKQPNLTDWGGYLESKEVYSLSISNLVYNKRDKNEIVDCTCNHRIFNYLEINSKGDVYLCLDDVELRTKYGNLLEQELEEIWNSDKRKKIIEYETTKGICSECHLAVWK